MASSATVYVVTNTINGHQYVGVTRFSPEHRWSGHVDTARRRPKSYLHRAISKYGADAFRVESLASCLTRDTSGDVERQIIQRIRPHYNQTNGGEVTTGRRGGPEVYQRVAEKNRGLRRTAATRAKQSAIKRARMASDPTYRAIALQALARGRANVDQEKRIAASRAALKNRVWSAESRAKLSASRMGRVYGPDVIDKARLTKSKAITCQTLDMAFGCCEEAAIRLGISTSSIYKVCSGARQSVDGLVFSYGV
jgi:group I intron endonuclease